MKRFIPSIVVSAVLVGSAGAQSLPPDRSIGQRLTDYLTREFILRQLSDLPARAQVDAAQRREAQNREKQFLEKTNKFVRLWSQFAIEYNEKNAFNIKVAQEISKAFHELEHSEGWPKVDRR